MPSGEASNPDSLTKTINCKLPGPPWKKSNSCLEMAESFERADRLEMAELLENGESRMPGEIVQKKRNQVENDIKSWVGYLSVWRHIPFHLSKEQKDLRYLPASGKNRPIYTTKNLAVSLDQIRPAWTKSSLDKIQPTEVLENVETNLAVSLDQIQSAWTKFSQQNS